MQGLNNIINLRGPAVQDSGTKTDKSSESGLILGQTDGKTHGCGMG